MKVSVTDLSIQGCRTFLSSLSFASLIIGFVNAKVGGTMLTGIPLTMFIYFFTKFIEYLEKCLRKQCIFGNRSIIINIIGLIVAIPFTIANLVFGFISYTSLALFIIFFIDLSIVLCYLLLDIIAIIRQLINHQQN